MSDLFKESLADAKAVRATAHANAKIALQEAFGERIQAMFAERLKTEVGGSEEELPVTDPAAEVDPAAAPVDPAMADSDEITNADLEEIIAELEQSADDGSTEPAPADPTAPAPAMPVDPTAAPAPAAPACDPTAAPVAPAPVAPADPTAVQAPAPAPDAQPQQEEEMVDLDELLAELEQEDGEGQIDLDGIKDDDAAVQAGASGEECDECSEQSAIWEQKVKEVTAQRDDAIKAVNVYKRQINEINLLNAKLLYTNKLWSQFNMTNEQKIKVVENFDLTTNVREVKLTYAIMAESFNLGGSVVRKKNTTATTITEGLASKAVASTKPAQEIVPKGNEQAERFKILAGINK